jgi:hypothetical protein
MSVVHCVGWYGRWCCGCTARQGNFATSPPACQQPVFFKADSIPIPLSDCSCFAQAVEYLFMTFYVFNVSYPPELRNFYALIEHILGMESRSKSVVVSRLLKNVAGIVRNISWLINIRITFDLVLWLTFCFCSCLHLYEVVTRFQVLLFHYFYWRSSF